MIFFSIFSEVQILWQGSTNKGYGRHIPAICIGNTCQGGSIAACIWLLWIKDHSAGVGVAIMRQADRRRIRTGCFARNFTAIQIPLVCVSTGKWRSSCTGQRQGISICQASSTTNSRSHRFHCNNIGDMKSVTTFFVALHNSINSSLHC